MYHYIIGFILLFFIYKYFHNNESFTGTICSDKALDESIYDYSTSQLNKQKY